MSGFGIFAGPAIGAVIGYCTNYIAVKMLFRPLKPVKIGNRTLPFTPGIIPKGQARMAKALGNAVGGHLLTKKDFEQMLLSEEIKQTVVMSVSRGLQNIQNSEDSVETFLGHYMEKEDYESMRRSLENYITEKISDGLEKLDVGTIIAEEGAKEVKSKFQGTMVAMFLNDELIQSIAGPIGNKVGEYIRENGKDKVYPLVVGEIAAAESRPINQWLKSVPLGEEKLQKLVGDIYENFVGEKAGEFAEKFHVAQIVEDKINEMDVLELENLLLGIMKKELNAVVNLGALIGFILGLLNAFF